MSVVERVRSLEKKHDFIQQVINRELGRPLPDLFFLRDLKIRKLRVKEEISRLMIR